MNTATDNHTADYYIGLRYTVCLRELSPEEGGGWTANIPELGSKTFVGDGDTAEEALADLEARKRRLIPELLADGVDIPEPATGADSPDRFSGRVLLIIPRRLHADLAAEAKRSRTSMNKLATELLAAGLATRSTVGILEAPLLDTLRVVRELCEQARPALAANADVPSGSR
jgi:predicted RNase H-like HicB family nuclease